MIILWRKACGTHYPSLRHPAQLPLAPLVLNKGEFLSGPSNYRFYFTDGRNRDFIRGVRVSALITVCWQDLAGTIYIADTRTEAAIRAASMARLPLSVLFQPGQASLT